MSTRHLPASLAAVLLAWAGCDATAPAPPAPTPGPSCDAGRSDCDGLCIDLATDAAHCGACATACPAPLHATARCVLGRCARGPCERGFFDLDGDATPGCEATCEGRTCTGPAGPVTLDAAPLVEASIHLGAVVASGAAGSFTQTSPAYTNVATVGEPTPPPASGPGALTGARFKLIGGLNASHAAP